MKQRGGRGNRNGKGCKLRVLFGRRWGPIRPHPSQQLPHQAAFHSEVHIFGRMRREPSRLISRAAAAATGINENGEARPALREILRVTPRSKVTNVLCVTVRTDTWCSDMQVVVASFVVISPGLTPLNFLTSRDSTPQTALGDPGFASRTKAEG